MDKQISLRFSLVFFFLLLLYGALIINIYFLQIRQHDFFMKLGQKQYQSEVTLYPPRACIYDRNGTLLAGNKEGVAAFIMPKRLHEPEKVKQFLQAYFPQAYQRLLTHEQSGFLYVKRRLTPEQLALIERENLIDIKFLTEPSRLYPIASTLPLVGTTDIDNNGISGIELWFNHQLTGTPALFVLEKDARSQKRYFAKQLMQEASSGTPITLTIESDLQFLVYETLQKHIDLFNAFYGAVIIMNPTNGEILSMVNIPDYDPYQAQTVFSELSKNKIISDAYELGSVIKVFAALAALEEEVVSIDELIDCKNSLTAFVHGRKVNTAKGTARGIIPFWEVISISNNIGIAQVAHRLDNRLYHHYTRLGFGTKTGIELPGEAAGFINPPEKWSKHSIISLSYGYEISTTLLQLTRAFAIIANNGYPVQPTIILNSKQATPSTQEALYRPETIQTLRSILEKTTLSGTARKAAIKGYTIMTKTGTANLLVNGAYDPTKNIFTCAGIVEKDAYQRVIVVCIHQAHGANLYAATVAVPLFEQIAEITLIHDKMV
jgi:cell division protein FtsI (penicillin-binding protein 3)